MLEPFVCFFSSGSTLPPTHARNSQFVEPTKRAPQVNRLRQAQQTGCDEDQRQVGDEMDENDERQIPTPDVHKRIHRANGQNGPENVCETPAAHVLQDERSESDHRARPYAARFTASSTWLVA